MYFTNKTEIKQNITDGTTDNKPTHYIFFYDEHVSRLSKLLPLFSESNCISAEPRCRMQACVVRQINPHCVCESRRGRKSSTSGKIFHFSEENRQSAGVVKK